MQYAKGIPCFCTNAVLVEGEPLMFQNTGKMVTGYPFPVSRKQIGNSSQLAGVFPGNWYLVTGNVALKSIADVLYNGRSFVNKTGPYLHESCAGFQFFFGIGSRKNTTGGYNR